jgi:uncharacterized protein YndB with AHSA1/START domain
MSSLDAFAPIIKSVRVECAPEEAFRFFTQAFGMWWPTATHSCIAFNSGHTDKPLAVTFDPRLDGEIVEHGRGGERHVWGRVLVWDPPARVAFTWHPGRAVDTAQRVEVVFEPSENGTRVTLTHSGWERLGAEAAAARRSYNDGWENVFVQAFASFVTDGSPQP